MSVTFHGRLMKLTALLGLLSGCSPKPLPPPKVEDLHFPVAVLYENTRVEICKDAADLHVMNVSRVRMFKDPPVLIDSGFAIYTLENLRSTHGGLWHMVNPTGLTEVLFDLKRAAKSGVEAAREQMRLKLDEQTWRDDLDEQRKALTTQQTLVGMAEIVKKNDVPRGGPPPE